MLMRFRALLLLLKSLQRFLLLLRLLRVHVCVRAVGGDHYTRVFLPLSHTPKHLCTRRRCAHREHTAHVLESVAKRCRVRVRVFWFCFTLSRSTPLATWSVRMRAR
eukprot:Tamp_34024.p1 GENE.Tamp_34024~~Tamp_34024.p1  ORF type:complete len:106 (-),score=6.99 Tamp_34024:168-485(-)